MVALGATTRFLPGRCDDTETDCGLGPRAPILKERRGRIGGDGRRSYLDTGMNAGRGFHWSSNFTKTQFAGTGRKELVRGPPPGCVRYLLDERDQVRGRCSVSRCRRQELPTRRRGSNPRKSNEAVTSPQVRVANVLTRTDRWTLEVDSGRCVALPTAMCKCCSGDDLLTYRLSIEADVHFPCQLEHV